MGRSGTTMLFDCLGAHPDLGWPSQYLNRAPRATALAALSRVADLGNATRRWTSPSHESGSRLVRLLPGPSEAVLLWRSWCGDRFVSDFLPGEEPSREEALAVRRRVRNLLRWQGKPRFAAKLTGPLRIRYLSALFPQARFLHLVRDPRATVNSLLNVGFWKDTHRMREPAWANGLGEADLEKWKRSGRSPAALAALQWRVVVERGREEARALDLGRYAELRYEDLVEAPQESMRKALSFFELPPSDRVDDALERRIPVRNMNVKWRRELDPADIELIEELTAPLT